MEQSTSVDRQRRIQEAPDWLTRCGDATPPNDLNVDAVPWSSRYHYHLFARLPLLGHETYYNSMHNQQPVWDVGL
jgi:hypothetical protein